MNAVAEKLKIAIAYYEPHSPIELELAEEALVEIEQLRICLEESVKLQAHYARLLNEWDGGNRHIFDTVDEWRKRVKEVRI